jgi:hypothetical protein
MKRLGWLLAFVLLIPLFAFGAMNPFLPIFSDPYVKYEVISTNYMKIVYEPGCEYAVNEFLKYGDTLYKEITSFYGVQPYSKLTVVFENDTDEINSVTDPVDNVIFIFLNSSADRFLSPSVSPWVRFVFTHELTHILLTQKGGYDSLRVYGTAISTMYNGLLIPSYFQEGLAEYTETAFNDNRGRLNDPMFEMYLRGLVLSNAFNGLGGSINYSDDGWYPIGAPYLVGGSFVRYLAQTYGATSIQKIVSNFSKAPGEGIPSAISKTLNQPFDRIVSKWLASEKSSVNSMVKNVGTVFEGIQLTHTGRWTALVNSGNNGKLYYYQENPSSIPEIRRVNTIDMNNTNIYGVGGFLYDGGYIQSMALSPNGKYLAFTEYVPENGGYKDNSKLFVMNTQNGSIKVIKTDGIINVTWVSNDQIACVIENGGLYSIELLNYSNEMMKMILSPSYMVITSLASFNNKVYFSASYMGKEEIYELDGNTLYRIIKSDYLMRDLAFSDNGNYLLFSAAQPDENGIFNIYSVDLNNGQFYRITNVIGGAFSPQVIGNRLFYAGYTKSGYDLFVIDSWKDKLSSSNGLFTLEKTQVDSSVDMMSIFLSIQKLSKPYDDSMVMLGGGALPLITPDGTSLNYSLSAFTLYRDPLGQNTAYALGNISTTATDNFLTLGLVHYGKLTVSGGLSLSMNDLSIFSSVGVPFSGLFMNKNFFLYPSLSYTLSATPSVSDRIDMMGQFEWNPSYVPDNLSSIYTFYGSWDFGFASTNGFSSAYDLKIGTSIPFIGSVLGGMVEYKNSDLFINQSITLPVFYTNIYDITGQLGLRYVSFSQFASYDINNEVPIIGVNATFGIDSLFNQTIPVNFYGCYNFRTNQFNYGVNLGM